MSPGFGVEPRPAAQGAHLARVSAKDAVHVGPDGDVAALEERTQDGGRVVTAVAFQRRHLPLHITRTHPSWVKLHVVPL